VRLPRDSGIAPGVGLDATLRTGEHRTLGQRYSWIWTVLAPETRLIWCIGDDADLPHLLLRLGYDVLERPDLAVVPAIKGPAPDAILIAGGAKAAVTAARQAVSVIGPRGLVAVEVAGGPRVPPKPVARVVRVLELAASPLVAASAELAARRLAREIREPGLEVARMWTGDRARANHGLGRGGWLRRRRLPLGSIVTARRGRSATVAEAAAGEAARTLNRTLTLRQADVVASGKLGIRLVDSRGDLHHLSLVAAETTTGMRRAQTAIQEILGADPPPALRDRIVAPSATGQIGPVEYVLEPFAGGRHPAWAGERLWEDCLEFLTALHHLPQEMPGGARLERTWPNLDEAAEFFARVAGADQVKLVERLHRETRARTHGLPLGGGHGDFWSKNLLVHRGRLHAVLDWEWASSDSLPVIDLLDFRAEIGRGARRGLSPGRNFTEVLWPLIGQGGDDRLRRLAEATGTPTDTGTLEGLIVAHWMLRSARAGLNSPPRIQDPVWFRDNVIAPLTLLKAQQEPRRLERPPPAARKRLR